MHARGSVCTHVSVSAYMSGSASVRVCVSARVRVRLHHPRCPLPDPYPPLSQASSAEQRTRTPAPSPRRGAPSDPPPPRCCYALRPGIPRRRRAQSHLPRAPRAAGPARPKPRAPRPCPQLCFARLRVRPSRLPPARAGPPCCRGGCRWAWLPLHVTRPHDPKHFPRAPRVSSSSSFRATARPGSARPGPVLSSWTSPPHPGVCVWFPWKGPRKWHHRHWLCLNVRG